MAVVDRPAADWSERTLVRLLIGVQMLFWVGYLLVHAMVVVVAVRYGGLDFYPFGAGDVRDPKDVIGLGHAGGLVSGVLLMITLIGPLPATIAALDGILVIATRYARTSTSWTLAVSTVLTVAFVVVQFTPWGALVRTWLID